jgi:arsenate reductase
MAEAYMNDIFGNIVFAESAGLESGQLNAFAVEVMKEDGINISDKTCKTVEELYNKGCIYDYVITVCGTNPEQYCPIFPGKVEQIKWSFDDPSQFTGDYKTKLDATRKIRNQIKSTVNIFGKQLQEMIRNQP